MSESADRPDRSSLRTFWTTLPGVLTGVAALITAIAGVAALFPRAGGGEPVIPPVEAVSPVTAPGSSAPGDPVPSTGASPSWTVPVDPCVAVFFADLPAHRRKEISQGVEGLTLIGSTETKRGPIGLLLLSGSEVVGAVRFSFTSQGELFTIERIVDARCAGVEAYANASRGGDKTVLQNFDEVRVQLGGSSYLLRLGYSGGDLSVGHFRRVVQ